MEEIKKRRSNLNDYIKDQLEEIAKEREEIKRDAEYVKQKKAEQDNLVNEILRMRNLVRMNKSIADDLYNLVNK